MKLKARISACFLLICLGLSTVYASPQKYVLVEQPHNLGMVKVLLCKDVEAANLEVRGGYKIIDPKLGSKIAKGSIAKQFLLRPTLDGLVWGEAYPGLFQFALVPNDPEGYFLVNGVQYSGSLYVYQIGNTVSLVNEVPIEQFVQSMLNPKVNKDIAHEALAAMAIIERTQAYYHALRNQNKFWHLDAQEINYQGRGVCGRDNGVDRAVELTHHLVMKSKSYGILDGFFNATYTENCAGKTAPYHLMYRTEGHACKKTVESPLALAARTQAHWTHKVLLEDLAEKLGWDGLSSYEVFTDKDSGKVYGMKFEHKGETADLDFQKLQALLGSNKIKSSDFTASNKDNVLVFDGYGEGIGVGACLYTAEEMAERGHNAAEILELFFPNTYIAYMEIRK